MARSLNVCVVGAGMSGLVAIKELLDEGHRVICFERQQKEGGNFNYPTGAAYDSMFLTVSQYHMAFSSFPPPLDQERRFWSREEYAKYLHDFATQFGLFTHINFHTDVVAIRRGADDKLQVTHCDTQSGTCTVTEFDAVAICSGAHATHIPRLPKFQGTDKFRGEIQHAVHYRTPEQFRGKHVVCVGFGETAADVATQIAEVAASCWISFRRYPSVLQRYYDYGTQRHTNDAFTSRLQAWLPRFVINRRLLKEAHRTLQAPADKTRPRDRLLAEWTIKCGTPAHQSFQKNDSFVEGILAGKLQVKPCGIQRLEEDSIVFTDGSRIKADVLMCCTGYDEGKPPNLVEGVDIAEVRQLYKHVLHPDLRERVAFIGWARPAQGGIPACSEMQSRAFALLCSGKRTLPDKNELQQLIAQDREAEERSFYARRSQGTLCSYTPYMDALAQLVGCRPRVRDFLCKPRLAYHLLCGANIPTTYRLCGPHAAPEMAQRVILSLPIAHRPRELAAIVCAYILTRLGVFVEPEQARFREETPV